jgi:hypothetical protein
MALSLSTAVLLQLMATGVLVAVQRQWSSV